jgi:hypothetical protein
MRDPVLITTFPNVWGLASFDRRDALLLCLFSDDLEVLKQQCVHAAVCFPRTFEQIVDGHRCEFDPHVEVRRFDGNALVARGAISSHHGGEPDLRVPGLEGRRGRHRMERPGRMTPGALPAHCPSVAPSTPVGPADEKPPG